MMEYNHHENNKKTIGYTVARLLIRKIALLFPELHLEHDIIGSLKIPSAELAMILIQTGTWAKAVRTAKPLLLRDDSEKYGTRMYQRLRDAPEDSRPRALEQVLDEEGIEGPQEENHRKEY